MAVSRLLPSGGANDFNVAVSNVYTSVTFNKEYSAGAYTISSSLADTTYDIYAFNANGTLVGYTNTPSLSATGGFNKLVILGQTQNNLLSFTYKTTFTSIDDSDEVSAGPVAVSLTPSSLESIDDTFTLTGRNFAADATVTFSSTTGSYTSALAKSVVRGSATSLVVTRPDLLPPASNPYTITVQNPGVQNPVGTNSHILANAITAGSAPVWVTNTPLPAYSKNISYSTTLVATDADATGMSYSIISGSLPTGLTLASTSGVISGTVTTGNVSSYSITVRATDTGGNFVDRAFAIPNRTPTWNTAAGALAEYTPASSYSVQLSVTDDDTITYSLLSGSLPTGITLSSSGLLSGGPSSGAPANYTFTVRATDTASQVTDRAFSIAASIFGVGSTVTINAPTVGRFGSNLAGYQSNCNNTAIANNMTVSGGIISLASVLSAGTYTFRLGGAQGAQSGAGARSGGLGYQFDTSITLTGTETLKILIGQMGLGNQGRSSGGGGGTFVWRDSDNYLYAVAGGGGGSAYDNNANADGRPGLSGTSGSAGGNNGAAGGTGGNGGSANGNYSSGEGAAGAGWLSNGASGGGGNGMTGGVRPLAGGTGGISGYTAEDGGFGGGGGGGNYGGGGGGGYSGGGAGPNNGGGGGGAGSYSIATMTNGTQKGGAGFITITRTA
jgi:hypothetical protein